MAWGIALGIGLPILTFLLLSVLDPTGSRKAKLAAGAFRDQSSPEKPPALPRELAQEYLSAIKKLYEQNYLHIFLPRLRREDLEPRERIEYFQCASGVLGRMKSVYLKELLKALNRPDSEIKDLAGAIHKWKQTLESAAAELDKLNPFPGSLRRTPGAGSSL